jgi:hypothetical protein
MLLKYLDFIIFFHVYEFEVYLRITFWDFEIRVRRLIIRSKNNVQFATSILIL